MMLTLIMGLAVSASAQTAIVDNGTVKDNWYVGGGVGTLVWDNTSKWSNFDPWKEQQLNLKVFGGKYLTPYIGAELDGTAVFNVKGVESNFIDGHLVTLNGVVNLSNVIAGYHGTCHPLNLEAIVGYGWLHAYQTGKDFNHSAFHGALRANVKVGKNLDVFVMPEYISQTEVNDHFNMLPHGVNLYVGVKKNITTKRGGFPLVRLYDQGEIDNMNARINNLIKENGDLSSTVKTQAATIAKLVGAKVVTDTNEFTSTVLFTKGSADVNVGELAKIVNDLKNTKGAIIVSGMTSPEGNETLNATLAQARAESVKNALISGGIDATRIVINNDYASKRAAVITKIAE